MARSLIDHPAAVIAARTWANQMAAWDKCSMAQRFMCLQILRITGNPPQQRDLFEAPPLADGSDVAKCEELGALVAQWKARKVERSGNNDSLAWMIEQLENCLGR